MAGAVVSYERNHIWEDAPICTGRNKYFGYKSRYDLRKWADRSTYFLGRWHDLPAQLVLAAVKPRLVIDIGANRGEFTLAAAHVADRVISFEPNPSVASVLKSDLQRNSIRNVDLRELGLSDEPATLSLCVPHINSGSASFGGFQSEGELIDGIPVAIGDDVLANEEPDLIKIDVEGFESRVIRGLEQTIERSRPVVITEVLDETLERCGSSSTELQGLMTSHGYKGFSIGTKRAGLIGHQLALGVPSADYVWLPDDRKLQASTKDLATFRRCERDVQKDRIQ